MKPKRPPKRKAKLRGGRVIDRLSEADRLLVLANVKEFMQYVKGKSSGKHSDND